jgi:hypothetical protein
MPSTLHATSHTRMLQHCIAYLYAIPGGLDDLACPSMAAGTFTASQSGSCQDRAQPSAFGPSPARVLFARWIVLTGDKPQPPSFIPRSVLSRLGADALSLVSCLSVSLQTVRQRERQTEGERERHTETEAESEALMYSADACLMVMQHDHLGNCIYRFTPDHGADTRRVRRG